MNEQPQIKPSIEEKVVNGIRYRKVFSGYTLRQYYSHETEEKGPGPGWDNRWKILNQYGVTEPSQLPDEPHYVWKEVIDDKKSE